MWEGWKWGAHVSYLLELAQPRRRPVSSARVDSNEMCFAFCILNRYNLSIHIKYCFHMHSLLFSVQCLHFGCIVEHALFSVWILALCTFSTPTQCEKPVCYSQQSVLHILQVEEVVLIPLWCLLYHHCTIRHLCMHWYSAFAVAQCSVMEATPGIGGRMARSH